MKTKLEMKIMDGLRVAYGMRHVRNQCYMFMTHNPRPEGFFKQLRWYYTWYLPRFKKGEFIGYVGYLDTKPVAYGITRLIDVKWWLTGGIVKDKRGQGLGEELFKYLIETLKPKHVWLDVQKTNRPAYSLYKKLGFKEVEEKEGVVVMKR